MRVLITGSKVWYGLSLFYSKAFRKLKCKVEIFEEENLYKKQFLFFKNRYTNRLFWELFSLPIQKEFMKTIEREKPDLIFVLKGWFFSPKTLFGIKKEWPETTLFCFNPDNPFNTWHFGASNNWIRKSIPYYDVYFIWGKFLIDKVKKAGAKRVEYLPFGYDPELHYPVEVLEEERKIYGSDIAFIGTWDKEREWWLNHLLDYDLAIWGNDWQKANKRLRKKWKGKPVYGEEFSKVCNSSKIILNLIRKQNMPAHNMKTFEVPACKGFVLSTKTKELTELFEEGKEIVCFSNPRELKEKINFYLKRGELRRKIANLGYERLIKSNYSYLDRAKKILEVYERFREK